MSFIITRSELASYAEKICSELAQSVTIMDINQENLFYQDKVDFFNGCNSVKLRQEIKRHQNINAMVTKIRIDTKNIYFAVRPSCDRLRFFTGAVHCLACDSQHSRLFHRLCKDPFEEGLKERLKEHQGLFFYSQHYRTPKMGTKINWGDLLSNTTVLC